jgi:ATP-binding cassette subfamily B protein
MELLNNYPTLLLQNIADCGASCLAIVCRAHGLNVITRICGGAGMDKMGTNAYGIVKAAEEAGVYGKGRQGK